MTRLVKTEGQNLSCSWLCIFMLLLLQVIFLQPLFANSASHILPTLDRVSLKLKWKHQFQFAGYYMALEKGFYRDAGLEVEILELESGEKSFDAVLNEKSEFGIAGSDLILKRSEGHPVVALAAIYQHSPMVFLTPESTGIQNIHQLAGRRVMLEEHSAELLAYLKAENINLQQLKIFGHSYGVKELIAGEVDVISAYANDEPFNLKEQNIPYRLFFPQSSGIDFYGDVLYTTENQIKNYPGRVKKFLKASLKGWEYALKNENETISTILDRYSKRHSREHLTFEAEGARKLILPDVVPIGYMNEGRWAHIIEKYQNLGLLKKSVMLDRFIYQTEPVKTNYFLISIQILEVILAALAVWFVWRFIRIYSSHEELNQQNKEIQRRLAKSQKRFSLLLSNLPGMAYRCRFDDQWTMIFVSQGVYNLTGFYPDELVKNRLISYSELIHPEDRKTVSELVKQSFHRGEPFRITYRLKCRDGSIKWVWEQGRFVSSTSSFKNLRIEGFISDVTEAKSLEIEREQLIEKLQQALSEIRELRGILPICSSCKKIRDDQGYWKKIESYIQQHTKAEFSHGICPDCSKLLYPEFNLEDKE